MQRRPSDPGLDDEESLYDAYLAAALDGSADAPDVFLARHGGGGAELRARLSQLYRMSGGAVEGAAPPAAAPSADAARELPFERLGEFRLLRRLGEGGMGVVYEAEQESLRRHVAVKVLRPELSASPTARERLRREGRAAARLRHSGVVQVLGVGEEHGVWFLAMDLVPGRSLDVLLSDAAARGEQLPAARVVRWGARLARALAYAHGEGVVHRDVKPSNVVLAENDEPLLLDFGVARLDAADAPTLTGPFVGSAHYAAPEQLAGAPADPRMDVYALGATLYECLTGRPPFEGATVDQLFHRVLNEEPRRARLLNPRISPDLDVVLSTALEKDPRRRYASAAAFADDLEALLTFQPIRARPPGPLRRVVAFTRRRPAVAAAIGTAVAALLALSVLALAERRAAERQRLREAHDDVAAARELLVRFGRERARIAELEADMHELESQLESQFVAPRFERELAERESELARSRRLRESLFHDVEVRLRRAQQRDPAVAGADEVRSELYAQRWREAVDRRDEESAAFFGELVLATAPDGPAARTVRGLGRVTLRTDPPGAEVALFRYARVSDAAGSEMPQEARLVPVPVGAAAPLVTPGAWALRVVQAVGDARAGGDVHTGDRIVRLAGRLVRGLVFVSEGVPGGPATGAVLTSIDGEPVQDATAARMPAPVVGAGHEFVFASDGGKMVVRGASLADLGVAVEDARDVARRGGVEAQIVRDGVLRHAVLPPGLDVRVTAAPLLATRDSVVGRTPLVDLPLARGEYVALLRAEGRAPQRLVFRVAPDAGSEQSVTLVPEDSRLAGFVRVPGPATVSSGPPFWIMEREVTAGEYLEFLNERDTLSEITASAVPTRFPREPSNRLDGGEWTRGADGRYALPDPWRPDWPVLGVSFDDAVAYAAWRTARDRAAGGRMVYGLPTFGQYLGATCEGGRRYVFGNRFRPKWVKSCFARPVATPEPVLSFPVDESPLGVFDLAGSVMEWCDDWYDAGRGLRRVTGGSWAHGEPERFAVWGGQGFAPGDANGVTGFRLVARERGPGE